MHHRPDHLGPHGNPGHPHPVEAGLDQPLAVVAIGSPAPVRSAVLGALLGVPAAALRVPRGSFLVVGYDERPGGLAYLPGQRGPVGYWAEPVGTGPALSRPPRRVELTLPDPLLRHFAVVDVPDPPQLGVAGRRLVLDAVDRAGALLVVAVAGRPPDTAVVELLTEVSRGDAAVICVTTPGADGGWPEPGQDPAPVVAEQRAQLLAAVPSLAVASWVALDPAAADPVVLRRALLDWAGPESLRRGSLGPPSPSPGAGRQVRIAAADRAPGWPEHLDRLARTAAHRLRQDLALELANIHLRCVQSVVFGAGCPGLPETLDRELHALSSMAVAECDEVVDRLLDDGLALLLGATPEAGLRRQVADAVRHRLAGHRPARDLDRALLVTNAATVEAVAGPGAVAALAGYPGGARDAVLPPMGVAVAGGAYQFWRTPANADTGKARSWLRQALREVELELARETGRRVEAVRLALTAVLADSVDHGVLRT
nr:hypothetical protein [Micromonospora sp. DSM 115978]